MYQEINESIEVIAQFKKGIMLPSSFVWNTRLYKVETISLIHHTRQGDSTIHLFSIMAKDNMYELAFDNRSLIWTLVKVWQQ